MSVVSSVEVKAQAIVNYRIDLESVWSDDAMFMNYLEGLQVASACADIILSKNELIRDDMYALLKKQAAVITVRGLARDENLISTTYYYFHYLVYFVTQT